AAHQRPKTSWCPCPGQPTVAPRVEFGRMRTDHYSYKWLVKDMEALGLRHRRGHGLRRTMISLTRTDGARKEILELCTHTPRKRGNTIDLYTSFPWEALCAEVAKLHIQVLPGTAAAAPQRGGERGGGVLARAVQQSAGNVRLHAFTFA